MITAAWGVSVGATRFHASGQAARDGLSTAMNVEMAQARPRTLAKGSIDHPILGAAVST